MDSAQPKWISKLLPAFAITVFAGVFALYAAAVVLGGGSAAGLVLYPLAFVLAVLLPGLWLACLAFPTACAGVRVVAAVLLGGLALMLVFVTLGRFVPVWLCGVPGALAGLYWLFTQRKKMRVPGISNVPQGAWMLLVLFSVALFLYIFSGVLPYARPAFAGNRVYSQDMLWSAGNAAAVKYGAPLRDLRVAGGVLHYHFFSDVLAGLLAVFSGQSAWDAVCYYIWPLWCALLCAALYLLGRGFGAGRWGALVAPFGVLFCHTTWDTGYWHIFTNMNGVVQSNFFLAGALLLLQQLLRDEKTPKRAALALVAAVAVLVWGKSTIGVLLVCALFAAFVVGCLLRRKAKLPLFFAAAGGAGCFVLLWALVYRGAINNLVFQPALSQLADAFIILWDRCKPALFVYAVSLVFSVLEFKKLDEAALAVNALVPGGIAAYSLFHHYSFSQSYFLLAAVFGMWLCAARVARRLFSKKAVAGALAAAGLAAMASTVYYAAPTLRNGVQSGLRCLHLRPDMPAQPESITRDDDAAARWLNANMAEGEVFATNRNARNPAAADGIFHFYTAASGRQAYVESWRYAMDYSLEYHKLRHNLEQVSDTIFKAADYNVAAKIAVENGIDYLLVYLPGGGHAYRGAQPVFESETVLIYCV